MQITVSMQDPTYAGTTYLYEAILAAAQSATTWRGFYAFATRDGVDQLIEDNIVHDLMARGGRVDLVVGLDAITNRPTLERMQELERLHPNFAPRVFWNDSRGLFHPKISDFNLPDGGRILIVGSGNLTPGGLRANFEAYTVATADQHESIDLSSLDDFALRHTDEISRIDDAALERAAANTTRPSPPRGPRTRTPPAPPTPAPGFGRILLAQVPRAGDRWAQVHFNADVINTYFRLHRADSERVFLRRALPNGTRGSIEARPCVYSEGSNRNYKIEIGAASGIPYPPDNRRPLLVFYEHQLRTYDYLLLMPDDDGYDRLLNLCNNLPSLGRGLPRHITDTATLARSWPNCPLLLFGPDDHQTF
ncbi:MAG: hypothetical protein F4Y26_07625 [Gammaproteobacteria bacterium]|nr:hypothetical protein [Gammaproteobacteria bacterium]